MPAIALPADPGPQSAEPFLQDFGGELTPFLGGPVQRINRIGTRMGLRVTMPPLFKDTARQWQARLLRGRQDFVTMEWPLLDLLPGSPPSPAINTATTSSVNAISIKGLGDGYTFKEGQWFSIIRSGVRHMHMVTAAATATTTGVPLGTVGGVATVSIFPTTRVTLAVNDVVEIAVPRIEGLVSPGDEVAWQLALEHSIGLSFSVLEAR